MKREIVIALVLILSTFIIHSEQTSASDTFTEFELTPNNFNLTNATEQTLSIYVTPQLNQDIDTIGVTTITFDPNIIQCVNITMGDLFEDPIVWLKGTINNTAGTITGMAAGSNSSLTSPGYFAHITFNALKIGKTQVNMSECVAAYFGVDMPCTIVNNSMARVGDGVVEGEVPEKDDGYVNVYQTHLSVKPLTSDEEPTDVEFYLNDILMGIEFNIQNGSTAMLNLVHCNNLSRWHNGASWQQRNFLNHSTEYVWYVMVSNDTHEQRSINYTFTTSVRYDLNQDGYMSVSDMSYLMMQYGLDVEPGGVIWADINEDAITSPADISSFLAHYGDDPYYP